MTFPNRKREPLAAESSAFADRLSAIASRSKADIHVEPEPEPLAIVPGIERRFWNPADMPEDHNYPAAA